MPTHTSVLTGRKYTYTDDPYHAGRRAAHDQCDRDDRAARAALEKQRGRRVSDREVREANHVGANANFSEFLDRVKSDPSLSDQRDPNENQYARRLAEFKQQHRFASGAEKRALERKILSFEAAAEREQASIDARLQREETEKRIKPALDLAEKQLATWSTSEDVEQDVKDDLASGIQAAKDSGDAAALVTLIDQCRGRVSMRRGAKAEALRREVAERQAAINAIESRDDAELREVHGGDDATQ